MTSSIAALAILLVASAAFSASETALFSVEMVRIHTLARQGNPFAKLVERLRKDNRRLLGTILLGNNAVNIGASALATVLAIDLFGDAAVGIATGVMTLLVLIFGEFLPKSFAAHHSERAAFLFAYPVYYLTRILGPLVMGLEAIASAIAPQSGETKPTVSEEEIKTLARMGVKAGTLMKEESELIERALLFSDITAEDVMTPEEQVQYLDGDRTIAEIAATVVEQRWSRYPVHVGEKDNVVGIVHIRDIFERLAQHAEGAMRDVRLKDLAQAAMYVPETKKIDQLLRGFQKTHNHMALVVNEYGSVVGLVTIEDLLEELVGEIADESDVDSHVIKRVDKNTVVVHGDIQVTDVNRFLNSRIDAPPNKTISRIILEQIGDLPAQGQHVAINAELDAEVLLIEGLHIQRVRLTKRPPSEPVSP